MPELEKASGLVFNRDFFAGYSPERINPGDKTHRLPDIVKVTSGSTPEAADLVNAVYAKVITAGTLSRELDPRSRSRQGDREHPARREYRADQRARHAVQGIGPRDARGARGGRHQMELPALSPGLVGGHCIGVDPYYLTHKAESIGFHPQMILAGRRINDGMAGLRRQRRDQDHAQAQAEHRSRARAGDGLHLQGERARHAQH